MIAEPIVLTGRLTYEDLLEIRRHRVHTSARLCMGMISLSSLALLFHAITRVGVEWQVYVVIGVFTCVPCGWLGAREYLERSRLRRAAPAMEEHTATLTADSVSLANEHQEECLAWQQLRAIIEARNGFIFVRARGLVWFYLPWRVLHELDRVEILATAAANGVQIRNARKYDP